MFAEDLLRAYPESGPAWRRAVELGIDVTLIDENLALSVEERILQLQRQLDLAEMLRPPADDSAKHR